MSTKKHVPTDKTRQTVTDLKKFGITQENIALYLDIDADTLAKHYRRELDTAATQANEQVANRLFAKAVEQDDLTAQMFWLKTRGRWREKDDKTASDALTAIEKLLSEQAKANQSKD